MARPKKNNADYFSHDNSMRNHRKIKALRAEFSSDGFSAYVMLLETLTEADNFKIELKKELDWKLLAGDFGIESERLKEIFKLMEELELIENDNGLIISNNLKKRLEPVLEKREYNRKQSKSQTRNNNGQFYKQKHRDNGISVAETGISVAETPQSKVKESKVKDIYIANAKNKNKPLKKKPFSGNIKLNDLYEKMGLPKSVKRNVNQWQIDAAMAYEYFIDGEDKKSSIFKCFKENPFKAKIAFFDCKELEKRSVLYFLKVFHELKNA
jgi:ssDNA-specific exonuclease RecJ